MLQRAAQYGISSKLLALLGGLNSSGMGGSLATAGKNNKDLIDATEEKLLSDKDKEVKGKEGSWD